MTSEFNAGRPSPFISPDKMPSMDKLAKSVISWHQTIKDDLEDLDKATIGITNFLLKDLSADMTKMRQLQNMSQQEIEKTLYAKPEEKNNPIIYAYSPENQVTFEEFITTIERASHSIYPVILNIQKESALAFRGPQQSDEANKGNNVRIEMPAPKGLWPSNPFKKKEQRLENVTDLSAYSRSVNMVDELQQVPVVISKYKAYHYQRMSDCVGLLYDKKPPQILMLLMEIQYYHDTVKTRINNVIGEAMRINLESEKKHIDSILGRGQDMFERRDMMPQYPQPGQQS